MPEKPPLVLIEVLSPNDRLTAVLEKLEEYRAWGVRHVLAGGSAFAADVSVGCGIEGSGEARGAGSWGGDWSG